MILGSASHLLPCYICAATVVLFSGCTDLRGTPRHLPSGRVIEVLSSGVVSDRDVVVLPSGAVFESPRTWAIRYRTEVSAEDREGLDKEATELWAEVQSEADATGATRASLWPANLDRHEIRWDRWHPVLYTTPSFDFTFEKDAKGSWQRIPHGVPSSSGSSEPSNKRMQLTRGGWRRVGASPSPSSS